jgi:3-oxoacyl-(acyl-carrier-protein) synthase
LPSPGQRQPERLPYNFRFPIVGAGAVNPVGETTCEMRAPLPSGRAPVFACGEFGAEKELPVARRRRLSRLQQMTLVAARRCLPAQFDPAHACVAIGTGLGSLNEAAAFVENLWRKDEREPLPQRFTNSVHNALAGQVAIELGARGLNSTPTCHEISFEAALWHALRELAAGTANLALAGAADELNPYAVAAGRRWGLPVPGEGAAVFALTTTDGGPRSVVAAGTSTDAMLRGSVQAPRVPPMAYLHAVRLGRYTGDNEAEARWIADTVDLAKLDVLLTGANGWPALDAEYAAVAEALGRMAGRKIVVGTYKQWCGEHASASAFGFSVAIRLVRGEVRLAEQTGDCRRVALYTLSPHAQKALCVVEH